MSETSAQNKHEDLLCEIAAQEEQIERYRGEAGQEDTKSCLDCEANEIIDHVWAFVKLLISFHAQAHRLGMPAEILALANVIFTPGYAIASSSSGRVQIVSFTLTSILFLFEVSLVSWRYYLKHYALNSIIKPVSSPRELTSSPISNVDNYVVEADDRRLSYSLDAPPQGYGESWRTLIGNDSAYLRRYAQILSRFLAMCGEDPNLRNGVINDIDSCKANKVLDDVQIAVLDITRSQMVTNNVNSVSCTRRQLVYLAQSGENNRIVRMDDEVWAYLTMLMDPDCSVSREFEEWMTAPVIWLAD